MMLRFHTQTAGSMLTAQQPDNSSRRSRPCSAAPSPCTPTRVTKRAPTEESARTYRTQQIIANESGVADIIDPLGGSWTIEAMTDEIEGRAEEYLRKIDEMGGMSPAISKGYVQREIQDAYLWCSGRSRRSRRSSWA